MLEKIGNIIDWPIDAIAGNSLTGGLISGIRESPILRSLVSMTLIPASINAGINAGHTAVRFQNNILNYVDKANDYIQKRATNYVFNPENSDKNASNKVPVRLGGSKNYRYEMLPREKTYSDGVFFYGNDPAHVVSTNEYNTKWSLDEWLKKKEGGRKLKPEDLNRYYGYLSNNSVHQKFKNIAKSEYVMSKFNISSLPGIAGYFFNPRDIKTHYQNILNKNP